MVFFSKRLRIKIPKQIGVLYNQKKNQLMLIGPLGSKTFLLDFKLLIATEYKSIFIVPSLNKKYKRSVKSLRGTFQAQLKQALLELLVRFHKTLKLVGVGFKAYSIKIKDTFVLQFKLGFSHFLFYKIPEDVSLNTLKETKIFLKNPYLGKVTQISAIIRSFKLPEIYKGKGILYGNEKVLLKKGKKVS